LVHLRFHWTLRWREEPISLTRKGFDLLVYLIEHRDRVVSRDDLLEDLWPRQVVEVSNLTQQIFLLRKALLEIAYLCPEKRFRQGPRPIPAIFRPVERR
jgi:DNA-binding winged helix-turn-helix (wHTH) protein